MSNLAIKLENLGKMYRLYTRPLDKVLDALGWQRLFFWRKHSHREFWALRSLSLDIPKGQRIGIIGRNGAGKSTLLRIISNNIAATEGTVEINGAVKALLELGTGFHPEFTGRENIRSSLALQGFSPGEIREMEEDIVDFAELDQFIDQPIKTYSSGMHARLAFSTATVVKPEILIVDEVLGAGDAYFNGKCVERMKELTDTSGATVLFVSHDMSSIQMLCERVVLLDRGKVIRDGDPLEVIKEYLALVRADEEVRIKASDMKLQKKQTASLNSQEDVYTRFLFHFIGENNRSPKNPQRIYSLRLLLDGKEIGNIQVGSPMDNDPSYRNYILENPGLMDWGPSKQDELGTYRAFSDFKGKYKHAPFEFAVPNALIQTESSFELHIKHDAQLPHPFLLEYYRGDTYECLGIVSATDNVFRVSLSNLEDSDSNQTLKSVENGDSSSKRANVLPQGFSEESIPKVEEMRDRKSSNVLNIQTVNLVDSCGVARRTFSREEVLATLEISVQVLKKIEGFDLSILIFTKNGVLVTTICDRLSIQEPLLGTFLLRCHLEALFLGPGQYCLSVGFYQALNPLDNFRTQSPLALWDRTISFSVISPHEYALPLGLVHTKHHLEIFKTQENKQGVEKLCPSITADLTLPR